MSEPNFTGLSGLYPAAGTQVTGGNTPSASSGSKPDKSIAIRKNRDRNLALYGIRKNIDRLKAEGLSHEAAIARVQQNLMSSGEYSPTEALTMIQEATLNPATQPTIAAGGGASGPVGPPAANGLTAPISPLAPLPSTTQPTNKSSSGTSKGTGSSSAADKGKPLTEVLGHALMKSASKGGKIPRITGLQTEIDSFGD